MSAGLHDLPLAISAMVPMLDNAAVAVFGATGALAAARKKHDILTFGFFAAVAGVGGGTMRDLLLGVPVFWVQRPQYLISCVVAAVIVWIFSVQEQRFRLISWLDAVGMSAYTVVGAAKAMAVGTPPISSVVMGVVTAAFGGVLRDVLAHEPSILLRREIYITAALSGAVVYIALEHYGLAEVWAGAIGFATAFAIRGGAILYGWSLPGFHRQAPPDDSQCSGQ